MQGGGRGKMNHVELVEQFIRDNRMPDSVVPGHWPFVTISRSAGAGGHLLAHVILTDFLKLQDMELFRGWHVFDRDLCEVIASDPRLHDSVGSLMKEDFRSEWEDMIGTFISGRPSQYTAYKKMFGIVRALALIGKVLIVGRSAVSVTRDLPRGVHVRVVAREQDRVKWIMKRFNLSAEEAEKSIRKQDAERRKLVRTFFGAEIDDPLLYDSVWNTSVVKMHEISHSVIEMIRDRAQAPASATGA
jgi:hypothetical protein